MKFQLFFFWFCSSYPGAMMIVIKTPDGRVEMHGNYMSTSAELEENSTIWNSARVDALVIINNPAWVWWSIGELYFEVEFNLFCEIFLMNYRILMQSDWTRDEFVYREKITRTIDTHLEIQRSKGRFGLIVFNSHHNMFTMKKFYVSLAQFFELSMGGWWIEAIIRCFGHWRLLHFESANGSSGKSRYSYFVWWQIREGCKSGEKKVFLRFLN